jgi:hypothetical protein
VTTVRESVREKLETWGKLTGVPVLAVATTSLIVASLSLLVGFCNYRLQLQDQLPKLEFTNGDVDEAGRFLRLYWHNTGKSHAWRGTAKLYNFTDDRRGAELGEADIVGAGAKVMAGYGGQSEYRLPVAIPSRFLVCVTYFNGDRSYDRTYLLSLTKQQPAYSVKEDTLPSSVTCR